VYHFDEVLGAMVMQYIEEPHIILRKGLIAYRKYSTLANDMALFIVNTLFYTSGLHLAAPQFRQQVAKWSMNHNMCALTEQVSLKHY
jgi:5-methylthioribose kinase